MIKAVGWYVPFILLSMTHLAFAGRTRQSAIVLVVEGDLDAQREIAGSILPRMTVKPPEDLLVAVAKLGIRGSACEALVTPRTRRMALLAFRTAMKQVDAAAVLTVQFRRAKAGARQMHVMLLLSTQTEPMIEEDIALAAGQKATPKLAPLLSMSLQDMTVPSTPATETESAAATVLEPPPASEVRDGPPARNPRVVDDAPPSERPSKRPSKKKEIVEATEPEAADEPAVAPERDSAPKKRGELLHANALLVADAAVGFASRKLEYNDAVAGPLRNHAVSAMGVYAVGVEVYPAVSSGAAFAKDIGLVGRWANSFEVESKTKDGAHAARGSFSHYAVGLRGRILTGGKKDSALIGLEGTYGVWSFAFSGLDDAVNDVLAVEYKFLRAGADARIPLGGFAFLGGAGYMTISSGGPFSDRFPHASIQGVDARVGGAYAATSWVSARALLTYTRIFSSAHSDLDAPYVAGGALDQYVVLDLGASAIF